MFPVHSTLRGAVGLGVFLHIFDIGKIDSGTGHGKECLDNGKENDELIMQ